MTDLAASVVLDIGGGTSEIAVISLEEVVACESIRVGGDELDQAIVRHLRREHTLLVGHPSAEMLKRKLGSVIPIRHTLQMEVCGRNIGSGLNETVVVGTEEIGEVLERPVARIIDAVKDALVRAPPELASDLVERGMILTGGGSLLQGLQERLREETEIPVQLAELPVTCVAVGAGAWLEEREPVNGSRNAPRKRAQR